ncbi:hypothetical protein ABDK56_07450 [Sphingomonas sp. ASV193]|uniref:hypothetical protein n=1 Tax=Sphingomonas sp. ASV193 TaxID=3144405 RepID=UPI0032E8CE41
MTSKTIILAGAASLAIALGGCASDKAGTASASAASAGETATTTTTTDSSGATTSSTTTTTQATVPAAPTTDASMPPPPAETVTSSTTTTTATPPAAAAPTAEPATASATTTTTEAVKAVSRADVKVGAAVYDSAGDKLGTVTARDSTSVSIKTGAVTARLPYASLGMNAKGLVVAVTKAEFEAAAKAKAGAK